MPLPKTGSKAGVAASIRELKAKGGRSQKQIVAIALSNARKYGGGKKGGRR